MIGEMYGQEDLLQARGYQKINTTFVALDHEWLEQGVARRVVKLKFSISTDAIEATRAFVRHAGSSTRNGWLQE